MANVLSDDSSGSDPAEAVDQLDELLDRLGNGAGVDPEQVAVVAEHLTEDLDTLLPTLTLLAAVGKTSDANAATGNASPDLRGVKLGDFKILRELGRGGMGFVFEAIQLSLNRRVALKILSFASTLDATALARFEREAQAAAALEHPRIVGVYARGEERGIYYIAMRYVAGQDLARFIRQQRLARSNHNVPDCSPTEAPTADYDLAANNEIYEVVEQPPVKRDASLSRNDSSYFREVARVGQQAAEAIQYAHEKGVIHRDIKPSNLLLDSDGDVWIADFGLAALETANQVTATGRVIGTLRYSSPEQLKGEREIDARSDVYALGATLYELATLQPAFVGDEPAWLLKAILEMEPPSPRKVAAKIPTDLESVILKAMAKEPRHRYQTALELAVDLQRFLRNEPVLAHRPTIVGRGVRWVQRNQLISFLLTVVLTLIAFSMFGTAAHFAEQRRLFDKLQTANDSLETGLLREHEQRQKAEAGQARATRSIQITRLRRAAQSAAEADFDGVLEELDRQHEYSVPELDDRFAWRWLRHRCHELLETLSAHSVEVLSLALSPGEDVFATGDKGGTLLLWNAKTGEKLRSLERLPGEVKALAFSPNGSWLVAAGQGDLVRVYETDNWTVDRDLLAHDGTVTSLAFSPDAKTLVSGSRDNTIVFWNTDAWEPEQTIEAHDTVQCVAVSPNGQWLATTGSDAQTKLWDLEKRTLSATFGGHKQTVLCAAFSFDSALLATAGYDSHTCVWDIESGEQVSRVPHLGHVWDMAFHSECQHLVMGVSNGRVYEWDVSTPNEPRLYRDMLFHKDAVRSIELMGASQFLVTASADSTVRRWRCPLGEVVTTARLKSRISQIAVAPDDSTVSLSLINGDVNTFDYLGRLVARSNIGRNIRSDIAYNRQGQLTCAYVNETAVQVKILSASGVWAELARFAHVTSLASVWLSQDASLLVAFDTEQYGFIWSVEAKRLLEKFETPEIPGYVAIAPNKQSIAFANYLFTTAEKRTHALPMPNDSGGGGYAVAYDPQSKLLASGGGDRIVNVWDLATRKVKAQLRPHPFQVRSAAFSNSGATLAVGSSDLRLWDVESKELLMVLSKTLAPRRYHCIAFAPSEHSLVAVANGDEGTVLDIWSTLPGSAATAP